MPSKPSTRQAILAYYIATVVFLLLDVGLDFNVRIAFLEPFPLWRAAYYGVCFSCLGLLLWRPEWTVAVGTVESLVTLVALILSFGFRALTLQQAIMAGSGQIITLAEILNFLLSGSVAYFSWTRGMRKLFPNFGDF